MLVAYAELYSASNEGCNDLKLEHRAMWDLHVMPKLEVTCELKCLPHSCTEGQNRVFAQQHNRSSHLPVTHPLQEKNT
jgi:hypothetical protein